MIRQSEIKTAGSNIQVFAGKAFRDHGLFEYLIACSSVAVDKYNDRFFAICKGYSALTILFHKDKNGIPTSSGFTGACCDTKDVMQMTTNDQDLLIDGMADNLPVLRKKLKMSQEDLANMIGSSRYTVMLYETKKRKMPWNVFLSLVFCLIKMRKVRHY